MNFFFSFKFMSDFLLCVVGKSFEESRDLVFLVRCWGGVWFCFSGNFF